MEPKTLLKHVTQHYDSTDDPMLLSDLGADLRKKGYWPVDGITLSLSEFITEKVPELQLIKDPASKAFVVVVPVEKESVALAAIDRRHRARILKLLPRPILLAFCVD